MSSLLTSIANVIGYSCTNGPLLDEALHLPGATPVQNGNKRLAMLGDAILKAVVVEVGYNTGLSKSEENIEIRVVCVLI